MGLLNWTAHARALYQTVWHRYRDASEGDWKHLLDQWVANRHTEGRGVPFTTIPPAHLLQSLTNRKPALPKFFKAGLKALNSLTLAPVCKDKYITQEEARAEPIWDSRRHHITNRKHELTWRDDFELNRLRDFTVIQDGR